MSRITKKYLALVSLVFAFPVCLLGMHGCGAMSSAIEHSMYEDTREEGTRNYDAGSFTVTKVDDKIFRVAYTARKSSFDFDASRKSILAYASMIGKDKGFKFYKPGGTGSTVREDIVMTKMLITYYYATDKDIPAGVLSVVE